VLSFCQNAIETLKSINKLNDSVIVINNKITINSNSRTIIIPAVFHKTNDIIEVVLCTSKGKAYESLLTTEVTPVELQTALLLLGYKSLENRMSDIKENDVKKINQSDSVYLYLQWADSNKVHNNSIENFIWDMQTDSFLKPATWFFNGLLTDTNGSIIENEMVSMIATNYDYTSILSLNKNVILNNSISGVHNNVLGEDTYASKADRKLSEMKVNLIIKPTAKKQSN